jgi:DNA-binding transcriptional MerR regulator
MAVPARAYLSIGEVLNRLRGDFADITISKIRFLESEGLIEPQRTPSGYRKFTSSDLERLRYVLLAQRDQYLPLKVIKDNLDAIDRGYNLQQSVEFHPLEHQSDLQPLMAKWHRVLSAKSTRCAYLVKSF